MADPEILTDRAEEPVAIARELRAEVDAIVEAADARLVARLQPDDELFGRRPRQMQQRRHARARVDQHDGGNGLLAVA